MDHDKFLAIEIHREALQIVAESGSEDTLQDVVLMSNDAYDHYERGQCAAARRMQERLVELTKGRMGEGAPLTLTCSQSLIETRDSEEDLHGLWQLEEFVLNTRIKVLGREHPDTVEPKKRLASLIGEGTSK